MRKARLKSVPHLTDELIRLKPNVRSISRATQAAKDATKTIPVVFKQANDPVGDGPALATWWKPPRVFTLAPELNWKQLEPQGRKLPRSRG